jgi:LacI family transcriptional regulator
MKKKKIKIKDIARAARVSPATVSQAFNHPREVNRKTRKQILEVSHQLGYLHHKISHKRHRNIAVIAVNKYVPFFDFYAWANIGILDEAQKHGFNIIIEPFFEKQNDLPSVISRNKIDGILVVGPLPREHVLLLKQQNLPLVLCGHPIPGLELHAVLPDGRAGMYEATKHLISLGHKKIAFISGGPIFDPVVADRVGGFQLAMFEQNLEIPKEYIVEARIDKYDTAREAIERIVALDPCPTAIICISDEIAFVAYDHLQKKGIKIPKDISLVGFDDLPETSALAPFMPDLTTVHVDVENLGRTAVKVLLEVIENPSLTAFRQTLPVYLTVRNSTAKPKIL